MGIYKNDRFYRYTIWCYHEKAPNLLKFNSIVRGSIMPRGLGTTQQKILLALAAGFLLALSRSPRSPFRILSAARRQWSNINKRALRNSIRKLYEAKLITTKDNADGSVTMTLSQSGRQKVLAYKLDDMKIAPPRSWDKKWRVVLFDIPEKRHKARDALRHHLRQLGCHELQKSVLVHPFECRNEVDYLVEFFQLRPFVRFITAESIDNELHLKQKWHL